MLVASVRVGWTPTRVLSSPQRTASWYGGKDLKCLKVMGSKCHVSSTVHGGLQIIFNCYSTFCYFYNVRIKMSIQNTSPYHELTFRKEA